MAAGVQLQALRLEPDLVARLPAGRSPHQVPTVAPIAAAVDTVVISLDGPRHIHDAIRRVKGAFERIAKGVSALRAERPAPRLIARSVVQRANFAHLQDTIAAAQQVGFDEISFLAADLTTAAFNRPEPWPAERVADVTIDGDDLDQLDRSITFTYSQSAHLFDNGFVAGGRESIDRIRRYYQAIAGRGSLPAVQCNAPWVSAVLEPGGAVRPCFFHDVYGSASEGFERALNAASAIQFRQQLDVSSNPTCRRCVCSLNLPLTRTV